MSNTEEDLTNKKNYIKEKKLVGNLQRYIVYQPLCVDNEQQLNYLQH